MKIANLWLAAVLCVGSLGSQTARAAVGEIYWTTVFGRSIEHSSLENPEEKTLLSGLSVSTGIALDIAADKIYWSGVQPQGLFRANIDGTGIEQIAGICGPNGLCSHGIDLKLDLVNKKIYWTESGTLAQFNALRRSNLDGSDVEDVIAPESLTRPAGLDLDLAAGKVYWSEGSVAGEPGRIRRSNLDGSGIEDLLSVGVNSPTLELDVTGGKMYWTSNNEGEVWRANLDGTGSELLAIGQDNPLGLQLDLINGQIYWSEHHAGIIRRANLDGTGAEDFLVTTPGRVEGLALHVIPEPSTLALLAMSVVGLRRRKARR